MSRALVAAAAVAMACAAALAQQAPPRDTRAAGPTGTAEIAGTIVADEPDARPIRNAQVGIIGLDAGMIRVTSSDDQGRFRLTDLAAGRYLVSGHKPPFVGSVYGARQAGRAGTAIALAEGERRDGVVLRLMRGGVITGVVTDEYGSPAPGISLAVMPPAGGNLQSQLMTMAFLPPQITDDRGAYRFSGLPAGEYLVVAMRTDRVDPEARVLSPDEIDAALKLLREPAPAVAPSPAERATLNTTVTPGVGRPGGSPTFMGVPMMGLLMAGGGNAAYAPVYYPGTVDAGEAQPVKVGPGEQRAGVDFVARPVATSRIEGMVIAPDGQPQTGTSLALRPLGQSGQPEVMSFATIALSSSARVAPDGKFTMNGVPPGRYRLEARTVSGSMNPLAVAAAAAAGGAGFTPPRPQFYASAEVSVTSGQPTTGVELRLQTGMSVAGKVTFRPTKGDPPKDASAVMIMLTPVSADPLALSGGGFARTAADGTFLVDGVMPGRYVVMATTTEVAQMLQWLPQSVLVGGREMADLPIEIKPGDAIRDVAVTLSDAQQEVVGTLQDAAGRPAPEFTILLFPADRAYWVPNSRRVLTTRPATNGAFSFKGPLGPPPGDYLLAALTEMDPANQYKPAFLAEVAKAAIRITVRAGQQTRQDIRIAGLCP